MSTPDFESLLQRFSDDGNSRGRAAQRALADGHIKRLCYTAHPTLQVFYLETEDNDGPVLLVYVKSGNDFRLRRARRKNGCWVVDD